MNFVLLSYENFFIFIIGKLPNIIFIETNFNILSSSFCIFFLFFLFSHRKNYYWNIQCRYDELRHELEKKIFFFEYLAALFFAEAIVGMCAYNAALGSQKSIDLCVATSFERGLAN